MPKEAEAPKRPAGDLLPVVYEQLRRLAYRKMGAEKPGHTLQPTALVHEAFLRLGRAAEPLWDNPGHFYAAAAEAMRRILVERARRVARLRHGGELTRVTLGDGARAGGQVDVELIALGRALERLEARDPEMASVVKLRYFTGLTIPETAEVLGIAPRSVNRLWTAARAWLHREVRRGHG